MDEFRIIKKDIIDAIFRPFLYARQTPYIQNQVYSNLIEEPRVISISSAWYKSESWYKTTIETIKMMLAGKSAGFFATDYLVSIFHGIKTKSQMDAERKTSDEVTFGMEYENIPAGQSGKSYFKLSMFPRKIKRAFYPPRWDNATKKNPYSIPKTSGDVRIISIDVASRANKANDNTIMSCIRLLPTHKGYRRIVVYIESSHGSNTILQALRIKELFFDFEADNLVLDLAQAGIGLYDSMSAVSMNEERGIEYPAFTVMESQDIDEKLLIELRERTLGIDAKPVVFPIMATQRLNSEIAVAFRGALQKRLFEFLLSDGDAEDFLLKNNKEFLETKDDISLKTWLLHPYIQTNLAINECVNLDMAMVGGYVKLTEPSGARKDRYTSLSYGNYFVSLLDRDLLKHDRSDEDEDLKALLGVSGFFRI